MTPEQRDAFARSGLVHLPGAVPPDVIQRIRDRVWEEAARRRDVRRDDPSTWRTVPPRCLKGVRERDGLFDPLLGPGVCDVVDALLGDGRWDRPAVVGQLLMSPPNADTWALPHKVWHTDFPAPGWERSDVPGVQLFFLLDALAPGQGGTLFATGTHRLVAALPERAKRGFEGHSADLRKALRARVPWVRDLGSEGSPSERKARFMDREEDHDGVPLRVVESTGDAGDLYAMHPWLLHNASPNCGPGMRMMVTERILGRDVRLYRWNRKRAPVT